MVGLAAYAAFDFANTRIIQSIQQAEDAFRKAEDNGWQRPAANQRRIDEEDRANEESSTGRIKPWPSGAKPTSRWWTTPKSDNKRLTDDSHATMKKIVEEAEKEVHVLRNLARRRTGRSRTP